MLTDFLKYTEISTGYSMGQFSVMKWKMPKKFHLFSSLQVKHVFN